MVGTDEPLRSFRHCGQPLRLERVASGSRRVEAGRLLSVLGALRSPTNSLSALQAPPTPRFAVHSFNPPLLWLQSPPFPTASSSPPIANKRCRTCQCSASLLIVTHDERITAQSASARWRWGCLLLHIPQRNETSEPKRKRGRWGVFTDGG